MTPKRDENTLESCGGAELLMFFAGGLAALARCAAAVDKLNVFPVPDGDTGTNLMRTVGDAVAAVRSDVTADDVADVGVVATRLAEATLEHARGNSGTIFAQLCAGLAESLAGRERADANTWAAAWELAASTARHSVNAPVDGTLLTVARDAAIAARTASATTSDVIAVWRAMANAAEVTVAQTPHMLAVLADAGVVDAGALGLALFFRGAVAAFTGDPLPDPATLMQPSDATRRVIEDARFPRYCTQFLVAASVAIVSEQATTFASFGDSLDIVGPASDDRANVTRIHLHADDPDAVVAYASTLGVVSGLRIEDMQRQRVMLLSGGDEPLTIAMIAMASGDGMRRLFESLYGVAAVVRRPEDLDAALDQLRAPAPREILFLVNDEHMLTRLGAGSEVRMQHAVVVPTRNPPEGVAAALAFDSSISLQDNVTAMMEAARRVRTVFVRSAAELLDATAALADLVGEATDAAGLVTLYYGANVSRVQVDELIARIRRCFPALETEVIAGGQPECALWIAVESDAGSNRH